MKTKLLLFGALAIVCAALWGCEEPDDEPTGTTEIEIPGLDGEYDQALVMIYSNGESGVKGLYSTDFLFQMTSSDNPDTGMHISLSAFHNGASFVPGAYTFPSTRAGTASCFISEYSGSYGSFGGRAISGTVNVAVSGSDYTITFNNVSVLVDGGEGKTVPVSFVYKGTVVDPGSNMYTSTLNPEFPGTADIEDSVGGTEFPTYMAMRGFYSGINDNLHHNTVFLYSEVDGVPLRIDFSLYCAGRGFEGDYTTVTGPLAAGTFHGSVSIGYNNRNAHVVGGKVTIAEANGVYTVTLDNLVCHVETDPAMVLNGTYTGICSEFYDATSK
jgi:hypothetical protein